MVLAALLLPRKRAPASRLGSPSPTPRQGGHSQARVSRLPRTPCSAERPWCSDSLWGQALNLSQPRTRKTLCPATQMVCQRCADGGLGPARMSTGALEGAPTTGLPLCDPPPAGVYNAILSHSPERETWTAWTARILFRTKVYMTLRALPTDERGHQHQGWGEWRKGRRKRLGWGGPGKPKSLLLAGLAQACAAPPRPLP